MKLQIKTRKVTEETLDVEIPCFFKRKDNQSFLAIFDESEVIKIYSSLRWTSLQGGDQDLFQTEIKEAVGEWEPSDEHEFRVEYEKAIKQIAIPRREITTEDFSEARRTPIVTY